MISILSQERLLGAALGSAVTAVVVFEQRRSIYKTISDTQSQLFPHSQRQKPISVKEPRVEVAHLWNKAVDQVMGSVIKSVSSRGW
ncbi:unnamed protein product [Cuscuta campestris]|uniref:Uncharacterized protein n=1 Tax=Cuscuta campestris TaxID=132261 RepID=A0A484NAB1_9ASTE|nr:unnamed protein product [Cuscuta campestris]